MRYDATSSGVLAAALGVLLLGVPSLAAAQGDIDGSETEEQPMVNAVPGPAPPSPAPDVADPSAADPGSTGPTGSDPDATDASGTDGAAEPLDAETDDGESLDHEYQVGIRVGAGIPFVFAIKYGEGPRCSDDPGQTFCRRFGSALLDLELAFGVSESLELSVLGRIGLTDDEAANSAPIILGLGIRAYGSPAEIFKPYFGARLILDINSSDTPEWSTVDFGVRGEGGLQIDFLRYLGVYLQLGATIQVLRGFYFAFDGTGGIQARFP